SRRRHTRLVSDWSQTCALPIPPFAVLAPLQHANVLPEPRGLLEPVVTRTQHVVLSVVPGTPYATRQYPGVLTVSLVGLPTTHIAVESVSCTSVANETGVPAVVSACAALACTYT